MIKIVKRWLAIVSLTFMFGIFLGVMFSYMSSPTLSPSTQSRFNLDPLADMRPQDLFASVNTNAATMDQKYPLSSHLPYQTKNLLMKYQSPLVLEVRYKHMLPQDGAAYADGFVKTYGLDPLSHTYTLIEDNNLP